MFKLPIKIPNLLFLNQYKDISLYLSLSDTCDLSFVLKMLILLRKKTNI